ncbi:hypothetical protein MTO96_006837 [Rhipicephalus appendiculatus]
MANASAWRTVFLQNHDDIHLQMISLEEWMKVPCLCVKSTFSATHPAGCKLPPTNQASVGKDRLVMTTTDVDFEVTEDGGVYIDLWIIHEIKPTSNSPSLFPHTYLVRHAEENCLLLTYDYTNSGPSYCLLWGLSRANVDNTTECFQKIESSCSGEMYDLTEPDDPCEKVDEG